VPAGFGALLLASVAVAVWRRRRRPSAARLRHRWLRRGGLAAWLVALATLCGLGGLNVYVTRSPSPAPTSASAASGRG
jgi:hypothetical protein